MRENPWDLVVFVHLKRSRYLSQNMWLYLHNLLQWPPMDTACWVLSWDFFLWDVVSRLLQDSRHLQITNVPMMEHMQLNVQHSRRCCFCFFHFRPTEKVHASQGKSCVRVKTSLQSQVIIDDESIKYQILVKKKQLSPVAKQGLDFLHPDTFAAVVLLL